MPKPPPTSPTTTRIFSLSMPSTSGPSSSRTPVGVWHDTRSVMRSLDCVVACERGARLDRRGHDALVDEVERDARARRSRWRPSPRRRCRASRRTRRCPSLPATRAAPAWRRRPRASPPPAAPRSARRWLRRHRVPARASRATTAATISPTKRTVSIAIACCGGAAVGCPFARLKSADCTSGFTPACASSAPVTIGDDAGHRLARPTRRSTRSSRAHAASARTRDRRWPGSEKLSAKRSRPVSRSSSSTRRTDLPLPNRGARECALMDANIPP